MTRGSRSNEREDQRATAPAAPSAAEANPVSNAISRLARLHKMIAGQLLRRIGLYPGQELVMLHLWETGPQRQTDLVRVLHSDAATMTRTIQRLEHAGFVRRIRSPDDRRSHIVEPTPASLAIRGEVERIWAQLEDVTVAGLDDRTRRRMLKDLQIVESNLADAAAGHPQ